MPRYDYEFAYGLRAAVSRLRSRFARGNLVVHTVLEELALYLIFGQADLLADTEPAIFEGDTDDWREWLAEISGDLDIEFLLFRPDTVVNPDLSYHFNHWNKRQFHVDEGVAPGAE